MTEDKVVGWHHRLNEREFEQAPGDSEGQGGLVCCCPWGCKKSHMTEQLNSKTYCVLGPTPGARDLGQDRLRTGQTPVS